MARSDDTAFPGPASPAQARRDAGMVRVRRATRWVTVAAAAGAVALGGAYAHGEAITAAAARTPAHPPSGTPTHSSPRTPAPSPSGGTPAGHAARPSAGTPQRHHHHGRARLTPAAPPSPAKGTPNTTSGAS